MVHKVQWVGGWPGRWEGGEKLELKLNSAQLGLEAWAELGNNHSSSFLNDYGIFDLLILNL